MSNLKIGGGPLLDLFDVVISAESKHQGTVSLEIEADSIPNEGLHESITLTDSVTGQSRTIVVSAIRRSPIRAVPTTMMLQKQEADGSCVAYGMLIDHSESVESSEKVVTPVIDATVAGVKVPITILAGGTRIQRIRLNFTKDLLEKLFSENSDVTCVFDVHWGSKRTSCTSDLSFSVRTTLSGEKK